MGVLDDLRRLSAAEEFFDYLNVAFDRKVVDVARLHILRRMGEYFAHDALGALPEREVYARCKTHLESAYRDFLRASPIEERVFKVHRDAIRPKSAAPSRAFVQLGVIERKN